MKPETFSSSKKEPCWILSGDGAKGKTRYCGDRPWRCARIAKQRNFKTKKLADIKKMKPPGGKVARIEGIG
ncbi:MAG: hypothetical protein ACRCV5_10660 [Afipia sp.]